MKKIFILLVLLILTSCSLSKSGNEVNLSNSGVIFEEKKVSTGIEDLDDFDNNLEEKPTILEDEEKDSVVVRNNSTKDDLEGKSQEEVVEEMGDYVNDLFNMIEEDVK